MAKKNKKGHNRSGSEKRGSIGHIKLRCSKHDPTSDKLTWYLTVMESDSDSIVTLYSWNDSDFDYDYYIASSSGCSGGTGTNLSNIQDRPPMPCRAVRGAIISREKRHAPRDDTDRAETSVNYKSSKGNQGKEDMSLAEAANQVGKPDPKRKTSAQ